MHDISVTQLMTTLLLESGTLHFLNRAINND